MFCFVTKAQVTPLGPKSLNWVSPFPLPISHCWCSFLEIRPVCVTATSAESVQSRAGPPGSWEGAGLQGGAMLLRAACLSDLSSSENHFGSVYFSTFTIGRWDVIMVAWGVGSLAMLSVSVPKSFAKLTDHFLFQESEQLQRFFASFHLAHSVETSWYFCT